MSIMNSKSQFNNTKVGAGADEKNTRGGRGGGGETMRLAESCGSGGAKVQMHACERRWRGGRRCCCRSACRLQLPLKTSFQHNPCARVREVLCKRRMGAEGLVDVRGHWRADLHTQCSHHAQKRHPALRHRHPNSSNQQHHAHRHRPHE